MVEVRSKSRWASVRRVHASDALSRSPSRSHPALTMSMRCNTSPDNHIHLLHLLDLVVLVRDTGAGDDGLDHALAVVALTSLGCAEGLDGILELEAAEHEHKASKSIESTRTGE
jgi:hypothetical protein